MPTDDADRRKGPGGPGPRPMREQAKRHIERDRDAQKARNPLVEPRSRWQRVVRYVRGRSGRR